MREERETKVFSEMEELYSRRRYLGEVIKNLKNTIDLVEEFEKKIREEEVQ